MALDRWQAELAGWAVPEHILARAPEPPWGFPVALFRARPTAETPSRRCAAEALPADGRVLDVGCGGGDASLALVPPATSIIGFDSSPDLLDEFARAAQQRGVPYDAISGSWPADAEQAPLADVVVCHHVLYNAPDLDRFVLALDTHARHRVVIEITTSHPLVDTGPLWRRFHGIDRPSGPTADLALEVIAATGIDPQVERFTGPPRNTDRAARVAMLRQRLCLPAERDPEIDAAWGDGDALPRDMVTIWWDTSR